MAKHPILLVSCVSVLVLTGAAAFGADEDAGPSSLPKRGVPTEPAQPLEKREMAFEPGAEGGVLPSMTIEAEDRIEVEFERPGIALDLRPRTAPGLDWQDSWQRIDLFPAALAHSSLRRPDTLGRPWLGAFITGEVVVFRPVAEEADRWSLSVVDSRGRTVRVFRGEGQPPERIVWDGRCTDGRPAWPGLVYTHVMETTDRAGNVRTYNGEGFELPPYRLMGQDELQLVMDGAVTPNAAGLMSEAASWLNQIPDPERGIEIRATARTARQARRLAEQVAAQLAGRVLGPKARITTRIATVVDAPDDGWVVIAAAD